jgi:hypothetical protein
VNTATANVVTSPGTGSPNRLLYSPLTAGGSTPPPTTGPCDGGTSYTAALTGTGDYDVQPDGTYYSSASAGSQNGCLTGPAGVDFDLYLYRWDGSAWIQVASSLGTTSTEQIVYNGTAAYYYWKVLSYSGSGTYTLKLRHP